MCWVGHPSGWRHCVVIVVELLSGVRLFATLWAATCQASLSFTASWSLLSFLPIESVVLSSHFILCCPFLLLPSVFPGIRVFSNDSLHQVAKVLELQLQYLSFQWIFRVDFLLDELVWSPCCPRNPQELFPAPQFRSINSSEDFFTGFNSSMALYSSNTLFPRYPSQSFAVGALLSGGYDGKISVLIIRVMFIMF